MPAGRPREPSLYDVLQVRADASGRDITRAYRRLARVWHPDARPTDAGAAGRFQALSDAYELLSDPVRRTAYDAGRSAHAAGSEAVSRAASGRRRSSPPSPPAAASSSSSSAAAAAAAASSSPPPLWPLGPATTAPLASRPWPAPGGAPVLPGPVQIRPLPGDPAAAQAWALVLAELVRDYLDGDRNRRW